MVIVMCTDKRVLVQDQEEPSTLRVIFETSDSLGSITGLFEGNNLNNPAVCSIMIVISDIILMELNVNKTQLITELQIVNYILKQKVESRMKCIKFETYNPKDNYSVLICNDENKNPRAVWKFQEKIELLSFRPKNLSLGFTKQIFKENHLAICFNKGIMNVYHYESRALVKQFKSNAANFTAIDYSPDGKLLGLACEDDNAYIIDAEHNELIYCLEGHKNWISTIIFQEQIMQEDEVVVLDRTGITSQYETNKSEYNSTSHTSSKQPVMNKEIPIEDFSALCLSEQEAPLDLKHLRRMRTSVTHHNHQDLKLDDLRNSAIYDVYTAGLDGQLGVWRIELFESQPINENNYVNVVLGKDNTQVVKLDPGERVNIVPDEDLKVFYTSMVKISNGPLNKIWMVDNILATMSKRCSSGSSVYLRYFYETIVFSDDQAPTGNESENTQADKSANIDSKYEMLKQTSVNIKTNVMNGSQGLSQTYTPKRERGNSSSPQKRQGLGVTKPLDVSGTNIPQSGYNQAVTSPDKRARGHSAMRR